MFQHVKAGSKVIRMLAGMIPMELIVTEVRDGRIITSGDWEFDAETGMEIDEELGWGPGTGRTGSHLRRPRETSARSTPQAASSGKPPAGLPETPSR